MSTDIQTDAIISLAVEAANQNQEAAQSEAPDAAGEPLPAADTAPSNIDPATHSESPMSAQTDPEITESSDTSAVNESESCSEESPEMDVHSILRRLLAEMGKAIHFTEEEFISFGNLLKNEL